MKKGVVLVLIIFAAWLLSPNQVPPVPVVSTPTPVPALTPGVSLNTAAPVRPSSRFSCDGRQYCSDMTSRAEAEYFIRNCPDTKMDGDYDGIPCENDSRF